MRSYGAERTSRPFPNHEILIRQQVRQSGDRNLEDWTEMVGQPFQSGSNPLPNKSIGILRSSAQRRNCLLRMRGKSVQTSCGCLSNRCVFVPECHHQERDDRRADLVQCLACSSANLWMVVPCGLYERRNCPQPQRGQGADGFLPLAICRFGGLQQFEPIARREVVRRLAHGIASSPPRHAPCSPIFPSRNRAKFSASSVPILSVPFFRCTTTQSRAHRFQTQPPRML